MKLNLPKLDKDSYSKEDIDTFFKDLSNQAVNAEMPETFTKKLTEQIKTKFKVEGTTFEEVISNIENNFNKITTEQKRKDFFISKNIKSDKYDDIIKLVGSDKYEEIEKSLPNILKEYPNLVEGYVGGEPTTPQNKKQTTDNFNPYSKLGEKDKQQGEKNV